MNKVLFRADANPVIGLGHLERSLALAAALRRNNTETVFLTNEDHRGQQRVHQFGFNAYSIGNIASWTPEDLECTLEFACRNGCFTVLLDSHEVTAEYLEQLRRAGLFVVARDDLALYPFPCQLVVNGNADAHLLPYRPATAGSTTFLLGPEYIVLKEEFQGTSPRVTRDAVQNVMVTVGGSDQNNLMPRLLKALDQAPGNFRVTAIVGPFFKNITEVDSAASSAERSVTVVRSPPSLRDFILEADLAITAGGQTLYELAWGGCPAIAVTVAPNQEGQVKALAKAGCIRQAGNAATGDILPSLLDAVQFLVSDADTREAMALAGQRTVDGKGAVRVSAEITRGSGLMPATRQGLRSTTPFLKGQRLLLRPLVETDIGPEYLSWLNDRDITKYLEVGRFPSSESSLRQYLQRFQSSTTDFIFTIIDRESGLHIGNVTLNRINWVHRTADTGLMIGRKEFWGRGYAFEAWSLIVEYAFQRLGLRKVMAGAVAGNVASIATLKKLGMTVEGTLRKEFFVDGEYQDVVKLGLFREEFYKFRQSEDSPVRG